MRHALMVVFAALLLSACNGRSNDTSADQESDSSKTGYEQPLERARDVEGEVLEAAERQKRAIEEQEGGG